MPSGQGGLAAPACAAGADGSSGDMCSSPSLDRLGAHAPVDMGQASSDAERLEL